MQAEGEQGEQGEQGAGIEIKGLTLWIEILPLSSSDYPGKRMLF